MIGRQGISQEFFEPSFVGESGHSRVERLPIQILLIRYSMELEELGFNSLCGVVLVEILCDASRDCFACDVELAPSCW